MTWQFKLLILGPMMLVMLGVSAFVFDRTGTELGRVPFAASRTSSVTLPLKAGEVAFWTDLDIQYEGAPPLVYHVELSQAGAVVGAATCDPLSSMSLKINWLSTSDGVTHLERGHGQMSCTASVPASAPTTILATLEVNRRGGTVALKHADLAIRQ